MKKKILHINKVYSNEGGVEVYLRRLISRFKEYDHHLLFGEPDRSADFLTSDSLTQINALNRTSLYMDAALEEELSEALSQIRPDLIFFHHLPNVTILPILQKRAAVVRFAHGEEAVCVNRQRFFSARNMPCELTPSQWNCGVRCSYEFRYGSRHPKALWKKSRALSEMKRSYSWVSHWVVASQFMRESLEQAGVKQEEISVLPYFVEGVQDQNSGSEGILFAGRLIPVKGGHLLLEALAECPGIRLTIIGDGEEKGRLQQKAERLGLQKRVEFLGSRSNEEVRELMRSCRLVVFPSIYNEPFGIVGIEAMAAGKPVVAFQGGGVSDWLEDGVNGFLAEAGNPKRLAERILALYSNQELCERMGERGKAMVKERFLAANHLEGLRKIFERFTGPISK